MIKLPESELSNGVDIERDFLKTAEGLCIGLGFSSPEMTRIKITHHLRSINGASGACHGLYPGQR